MSTELPAFKDGETWYGNFELVRSFTVPSTSIPVQKWRSKKTGLSFVHAANPSPIVALQATIPTEIMDDTGRPHTLEHLVFLGSEAWPYKGILDNLANRSFADGTNAWTDTDHTAYTIECAGGDGFLKILPVYVDHILYPTLTAEGFVTEVHHINGLAENAGVVYSEMQARENGSGDLMALKMQQLTYPKTNAYRSETGGLMAALRELTVEQIREYHSSLYVPHNLCLVVSGASCRIGDLLHTLQTVVEPRILAMSPPPPKAGEWKRPFVETTTKDRVIWPAGSRKEVVRFIESDESVGEIQIGLGDSVARDDWLGTLAVDVLTTYLTDSPVAPLNKEFVEIAEPFCTSLDIYTATRVTSNELCISLSDVPAEHLETIDEKVKAALLRIASEGLDMKRMEMVLRRERRQMLYSLESRPDSGITQNVIEDLLYGKLDGSDLEESFGDLKRYQILSTWSSSQWAEFLKRYFVLAPSFTIIGKPSAALAKKLEKDEKARIAAQRKALGEEGLAQKVKELEAAQAFNDRDIPKDILESFTVPDVKSVSWVPVETASDAKRGQPGQVQQRVDQDEVNLPLSIHFASIDSKSFLTVTLVLSTSELPARLRPYASVWQDSFYSLPIVRADGTKLSHEEVIDQLNDQTVDQQCEIGYYDDLIRIQLRVEKDQYAFSIAWIRDLLWGSIFDAERLEVTIAKLVQGLPQLKRDGDSVSRGMMDALVFDEAKSTAAASNGLIRQLEFLPELQARLKENPDSIVKDLEEFRSIITQPNGMRVSVAGNILELEKPRSAWAEHFKTVASGPTLPVSWARDARTAVGQAPSKKCVVVSLPSIEGSYSRHTAKGLTSWQHPDFPALEVTQSMLNALESYLWKFIRGAGLAYGAGTSHLAEMGTISFYVYKSPDASKAFTEASRVIHGLADGSIELDEQIIDGAKSSLVYAYARKEKNMSSTAGQAFTNETLKGLPLRFSQELLSKIQDVTKEQIAASLKTYFLPLFDPSTSIVTVASAAGKADEIAAAFEKFGYDVEKRELPSGGAGSDDDSEMGSGSESGSGSGDEGSEDEDMSDSESDASMR